MELRLLESFRVLAEELHFGRAAARLHIAQPPLTKQIQQLERQLGVQLFERHPKGVRLTPAGDALKAEAQTIFSTVDDAVFRTRNAEKGKSGKLIIGLSGATGLSYLPPVVRKIVAASPNVDVDAIRFSTSAQVADAVSANEVDLGYVLPPYDHTGLTTRPVATHRPVLVVAHDHPLAGRESVPVAALKNEDFIVPQRYTGSALLALIEQVCGIADFTPRIINEAADSFTILALVAGGLGISITVTGVDVLSSELSYVPLEGDLPTLEAALAWRSADPSRLVANAIEAAIPESGLGLPQK